jgi:glycosyltransferase involved in cell wall biosynthesis
MSFTLGIGIVTYNRKEILSGTIDQVRAFTRQPDAALVVADDGSNDGTLKMLRDKQVPVINVVNMGIAWNKNRALFILSHMLHCDTVILLEDDTRPVRAGWESEWIIGAKRWGHVNYGRDLMRPSFLSGSGTGADPYRCRDVTAQCSSYSKTALTYGGYFDSRFKGYGHEHVEHSRRLVRVGYGGIEEVFNGEERIQFNLIKGDVEEVGSESYLNPEQAEKNLRLAHQIMGDEGYRSPWGPDKEMRQFRSETESAMSEGPERFRLTPAGPGRSLRQPARRGLFARFFGRSSGAGS